jgi:hypothetical protein
MTPSGDACRVLPLPFSSYNVLGSRSGWRC